MLRAPWVKDSLVILFVIGLLFSYRLGDRPFASPDEGRYVDIPSYMVKSGDYITPRFYQLKYFEKPPLFYWAEAGIIKLFGTSEWATRLAPMLFALLGCLMVYGAGSKLFGRKSGLIASCVLATSFLYFALSRMIILDMALTVMLSGMCWAFLLGIREKPGLKRRIYFGFLGIFLGLSVLTKGLVALVIMGGSSLIWCLWQRQIPWPIYPFMVAVFFLITALPWHIAVILKNPEFFDFYFIQEQFLRYFTKMHYRYQPVWFFIPILIVGFMPWTIFLKKAFSHTLTSRGLEGSSLRFLNVWCVFILVFFSFSSSKLIPYILPIFPQLALLVGYSLSHEHTRNFLGETLTYVLFGFIVGACYPFLQNFIPKEDFLILRPFLKIFAFSWILAAIAGIIAYKLKKKKGLMIVVGFFAIAHVIILVHGSEKVSRVSAKQAALIIKERMPSTTQVISFQRMYNDLPVYLDRPIMVMNERNELDFGQKQEPEMKVLVTINDLPALWKVSTPVCIVFKEEFRPLLVQTLHDQPVYSLYDGKESCVMCNV